MEEKGAAFRGPVRRVTVALAGNPNSGKTTIFNELTGARQHVANYPGVTVECKEGRFRHKGAEVRVVDLPGTYSLTAYSIEELIARNHVLDEKPDVVVDIVDASNLERNLYLAVQFMELGVPLILVFNMSDMAKARGFDIGTKHLSELLGVEIVETIGHKGVGIADLKDAILHVAAEKPHPNPEAITYGGEIEEELLKIVSLIEKEPMLTERLHGRWLAMKLLENDSAVREQVEAQARDAQPIFDAVTAAGRRIERDYGDTPDVLIADGRYGFISGACSETVRSTVESRHTMSDRIDGVVTNRVLGIPIFLALMYLVFKLTFTLGDPPMGWIESFFEWLGGAVQGLWPEGAESALQSLLVDGVIAGVGGVLVFLPSIVLLFLAIALLEDSGYMARAAFIMDRLMHKIGLHGKSFIPMLIGFGCTVPAIMATRMLETRRDRLTTMLVVPLMSCGARLPIYALFIPAFFDEKWQAPVLWILYLSGIVMVVLLAKLLRSTIFRGEAAPFVMELPPYRVPTFKGVLIHMWNRSWMFLKKAGTIIVAISIVLWAMMSYPKPPEARLAGLDDHQVQNIELDYSIAGRVGHAIAPIMRPIGFDWKTSTAMIGAFAAKEVFVAQLGIIHSLGEAGEESEPLRTILKREYNALQAFCIMLFCLLSVPCMVTVATIWRESGSWKWAALQVFGLTAVAYLVTLVVYQVGSALQIGVT